MEEWRPIPGTGGRYDLSSEGRVRAWFHCRDATIPIKEPRILNLTKDYHSKTMLVTLYYPCEEIGQKTHRIRSLMRDVWMKGKIPGYVVHSKNNVKSDCPLRNLEYTTKQSITKSGRGNRRAVMRLENGMVTRIYKSGREAAKAEHLTPSGMHRRIQRGTIVDGVQFIYGD